MLYKVVVDFWASPTVGKEKLSTFWPRRSSGRKSCRLFGLADCREGKVVDFLVSPTVGKEKLSTFSFPPTVGAVLIAVKGFSGARGRF